MSGGSLACKCLKVPKTPHDQSSWCKTCLQAGSYCAFCYYPHATSGCIESSFDNEDACKGYIDFPTDCPSDLVADEHPFLRAVKEVQK